MTDKHDSNICTRKGCDAPVFYADDSHKDYGFCLEHGVQRWFSRFQRKRVRYVAQMLVRAGMLVASERDNT